MNKLYYGKDLTIEELNSFIGKETVYTAGITEYKPSFGILLKAVVWDREYFKIWFLSPDGETSWYYLSTHANTTNGLKVFD